jgi:hypothetical protein
VRVVLEGDPTTAWCEGGGDAGQGTALTFELPAGCGLAGVVIQGGYFKSAAVLAANDRVAELELRTGGRRFHLDLDDPVEVDFHMAETFPAFVDLRIDEPGRELELVTYDVYYGRSSPKDLCISEVEVLLYPRE